MGHFYECKEYKWDFFIEIISGLLEGAQDMFSYPISKTELTRSFDFQMVLASSCATADLRNSFLNLPKKKSPRQIEQILVLLVLILTCISQETRVKTL